MTKKKKHHPYQQMVYIHKTISHTKGKYLSMDVTKTFAAMRKLSSVGFMMYVYLCVNHDNDTMVLSCKEFRSKTGLSRRSYIFAKKDLIKNNYLILREDGDFDFYNYPLILSTRKDELMDEILNKIDEENKNKIF